MGFRSTLWAEVQKIEVRFLRRKEGVVGKGLKMLAG